VLSEDRTCGVCVLSEDRTCGVCVLSEDRTCGVCVCVERGQNMWCVRVERGQNMWCVCVLSEDRTCGVCVLSEDRTCGGRSRRLTGDLACVPVVGPRDPAGTAAAVALSLGLVLVLLLEWPVLRWRCGADMDPNYSLVIEMGVFTVCTFIYCIFPVIIHFHTNHICFESFQLCSVHLKQTTSPARLNLLKRWRSTSPPPHPVKRRRSTIPSPHSIKRRRSTSPPQVYESSTTPC